MNLPICAICHANKYMAPIKIHTEWDSSGIRFDNTRTHIVNLYLCGKCGTVRADNVTCALIKEKREKEYEERLNKYGFEKI